MIVTRSSTDAFCLARAGGTRDARYSPEAVVARSQQAQSHLFGHAREMFASSAAAYAAIDHDALRRQAKALISASDLFFQPNIVTFLSSVEQFQQATPVMIPLIMAEPTILGMARSGMLDGYSGKFMDYESHLEPKQRTDYRRIYDGVEDEDGFFNYYSEADTDDRMDPLDQISVARTHEALLNLVLFGGDDPTSEENNGL